MTVSCEVMRDATPYLVALGWLMGGIAGWSHARLYPMKQTRSEAAVRAALKNAFDAADMGDLDGCWRILFDARKTTIENCRGVTQC